MKRGKYFQVVFSHLYPSIHLPVCLSLTGFEWKTKTWYFLYQGFVMNTKHYLNSTVYIYLSICPIFIYLSIYPFLYLSIYLSTIHLFICLSLSLSLSLSISLSIYLGCCWWRVRMLGSTSAGSTTTTTSTRPGMPGWCSSKDDQRPVENFKKRFTHLNKCYL